MIVVLASSLLNFSFADAGTTSSVNLWLQIAGGSVLVNAEGLAPNSEATIIVKNVIANVETHTPDGTKVSAFADSIVAGQTMTDADGRLEYALGVPRDEVKIIERWISNSTGQEEILDCYYYLQISRNREGHSAGSVRQ